MSNIRVKLFKSLEDKIDELESDMNAWLAEADVDIVDIFGNVAPQTVVPGMAKPSGGRQYGNSDLYMAVVYAERGEA